MYDVGNTNAMIVGGGSFTVFLYAGVRTGRGVQKAYNSVQRGEGVLNILKILRTY